MTADILSLVNSRWLSALGLGLLHAVWQAGVIVGVTALVLRDMRGARATARYVIAYAGLLLVPLVCAATVWRIATGGSLPLVVPLAGAAWLAPWLGCAWIAGVGAGSVRLALGWMHLRRLRASASPATPSWQMAVDAIAPRLGIVRRVRLMETDGAEVPGVIGWLSPLILFPVGVLASLPPHQIQLILTHELAHVRRHDYFWNFLQTGIETTFFFHPAVWWLSGRIREEREHCCDDIVLAHATDGREYAKALTAIERLRGSRSPEFALAASGGSLLSRVQRLIDGPPPNQRRLTAVAGMLAAAVSSALILAAVQIGSVPPVELVASSVWLGAALGIVVGMRHALEPDHLVAVSVLVAGDRRAARVARLGFSWGVGHSLTLLLAGGGLALVRTAMPERAAEALEASVGLMLIGLGFRALRSARALATRGPETRHAHGSLVHVHAMSVDHVHLGPLTVARRPLVVGMVHGLAGSGALAAMAMATLPTIDVQVAFMVLFGIGSTAGMAALSGLAGLPLAHLARRPVALAWVSAAAGVVSMVAGVVWGAPLVSRFL